MNKRTLRIIILCFCLFLFSACAGSRAQETTDYSESISQENVDVQEKKSEVLDASQMEMIASEITSSNSADSLEASDLQGSKMLPSAEMQDKEDTVISDSLLSEEVQENAYSDENPDVFVDETNATSDLNIADAENDSQPEVSFLESEDSDLYNEPNKLTSNYENETEKPIYDTNESEMAALIEEGTGVLIPEDSNDNEKVLSNEQEKVRMVVLNGKRYELPENGNYVPTEETPLFSTSVQGYSIGKAVVKGEIVNSVYINGIPAYYVTDGDVTISYEIADIGNIDSFDNKGMSVIDDNSTKSVFGVSLNGKKVHKGALILQSSKDGSIWVTEKIIDNYFNPEQYKEELYKLNDIQIKNGCFFRIIVAYKKQIEIDPTYIWFIKIPQYETEKNLEFYEFYLCSAENVNTSGTRYELGDVTKVKSAQGYFDQVEMEEGDAHYGWRLGTFFVSGFSSYVEEDDKTIVFLKNVGDTVTLGFQLFEDINSLNNDPNLKISIEKKGSDKEFQISSTEFGKGALIVQSYDYSNRRTGPIINSNYLEASARPATDNVIGLYEEGDYEVALDYSIEDKRNAFLGIPSYSHYRIRFRFKVRNGNCMVFPFDVKTNAELTNSSFTKNGFRLDLANSRYLIINIEKEVLSLNGSNIAKDTRFNKSVPDGSSYTDEGIYTIKVKNRYTGLDTEKVIYVGDNPIMKAYVMTGLSLNEINQLLHQGYEIDANGNIVQLTALSL